MTTPRPQTPSTRLALQPPDRNAGGEAFRYATSHPLVGLGGRLRKDLTPAAAGRSSVAPAFLVDPAREVLVYRDLLPRAQVQTVRFHGGAAGPDQGYWIEIENVAGPVLWQVGDFDVWLSAARWTADMHRRLAPFAGDPPAPLIHYDRVFYDVWAERAQAHAPPQARGRTTAVADGYRALLPRLLALPAAVIHGELYPSNVMVVRSGGSPRICPVDWEMAAVGPVAVDVAALAGGWPQDERAQLIAAYASAAGADSTAFTAAVDLCELHLCLRWLGWSDGWTPPAEHAQDWLGRAEALLERSVC